MAEYEKIGDREKHLLFRQWIRDRTRVQFQIAAFSMDGLTVVRDVRKFWGTWYFLADMPESLWRRIDDPKTAVFDFECTGRDRLKYRFRAVGARKKRNRRWLRLPAFVERLQKRESFRVHAGIEAAIEDAADNALRGMTIVNLSEGGALVQFETSGKAGATADPGKSFTDAELILHLEETELRISVRRMEVGRVTLDTAGSRGYCVLHFTDMDADQRRRLARLICDLQREFLKNRLPVGG